MNSGLGRRVEVLRFGMLGFRSMNKSTGVSFFLFNRVWGYILNESKDKEP